MTDLADVPHNLDAVLQAAADKEKTRQSYSAFLWYRGIDTKGVHHSFRFGRGGEVAKFHDYLRKLSLVSVTGPFKTRKAAEADEE